MNAARQPGNPVEIGFRPLAEEDLPRMFQWLSRPHVSKWYSPAPSSYAEVRAKYEPRTEEGHGVSAFVIEAGGVPVGYIQAYAVDEFPEYERLLGCEKGVVGVDLFIGEERWLRRGVGTRALRQFVEDVLFGHYNAIACVAAPHLGDGVAIRAFRRAGFAPWKDARDERGERVQVLRRDRESAAFRIETIDALDEAVCVQFRRDMYATSFGTEEGLEEEMGPGNERYLEQLRAHLAEIPEGNAHLWHGDRIVGQIEMRLPGDALHVAHVSLFYIVPEYRGRGLGRMLHAHAVEVGRRRGRRLLRLSVALANQRAITVYRELGWVEVGPKPHRLPMATMEFDLG